MKTDILKIARYIYAKQLYAYNIKSLSKRIQQYYLNEKYHHQSKRSYDDLNEKQKQALNQKIEQMLQTIDLFIQKTTSNPQYRNWLCNVIKAGSIPLDNFNYWDFNDEGQSLYFQEIKLLFDNYNIIKKVSNDKTNNNINNFKSLDQLNKYVRQQMKNNQQAVRNKIIKTDISKLFGKTNYGKYDVHYLTRQDMISFQQIYGKSGYSCAWCVANGSDTYNRYVQDGGYLYLITYANNSKPYALLSFSNYNSNDGIQFRDIHNNLMSEYDVDISKMVINLIFDQFAQSGYDMILKIYDDLDDSVAKQLNKDFMKTLIDNEYNCQFVQILDEQQKKQLFMKWADNHQNRKLINAVEDHVFLEWYQLDQQLIKCFAKNNCAGILIDYIQNNKCDLDNQSKTIIVDMYLRNSKNSGYLLKLIQKHSISGLCFTSQQVEQILSKCNTEQDKIIVLQSCSDYMFNHNHLVSVSNLAKEVLINWIKTKNNILKNQDFKKAIATDKLSLFNILFDGLDQNLKKQYQQFIQK